jgi:hypothetical protein
MVQSVSCTAAPNACPSNVAFTGTSEVRLCHADNDCTAGGINTNLTQCCSASYQGTVIHLCLNSTLAGLTGGAVTCP